MVAILGGAREVIAKRPAKTASTTGASALAAGPDFTCAITRAAGNILCWGNADQGKTAPPSGTFDHIALGPSHGCGVRRDGALACWGHFGKTYSPPEGRYRSVATGHNHACAIRVDKQMRCWGLNKKGEASPPDGQFNRVVAGGYHTCAITTSGRVRCWGYNRYKQCDAPEGEFIDLTASMTTTCGVRRDGSHVCWGKGPATRLPGKLKQAVIGHIICGLTQAGKVVCERGIPPTDTFVQIAGSVDNLCGLESTGEVSCWGANKKGERDPPTALAKATTVGKAISTRPSALRIAAGYVAACRIDTGGKASCWGEEKVSSKTKTGRFRQIVAGETHVCALDESGQPSCWGDDDYGQISRARPRPFTEIAAGGEHTCGVEKNGGAISCWGAGRNRSGGAHRGQAVTHPGPFAQVSAGGLETCGLRPDGKAICWGRGYGDADSEIDGTFTQISVGDGFACGVSPRGDVLCWGGRQYKKSGMRSVSAGYVNACGIQQDGRVTCWGGSLEDPPAGHTFAEISVGRNYACGLTTAGKTVCWGSAGRGQTEPWVQSRPAVPLPGRELLASIPQRWTAVEKQGASFVRRTFCDAGEATITFEPLWVTDFRGQDADRLRMVSVQKDGDDIRISLQGGEHLTLTYPAAKTARGTKVGQWRWASGSKMASGSYYIPTRSLKELQVISSGLCE